VNLPVPLPPQSCRSLPSPSFLPPFLETLDRDTVEATWAGTGGLFFPRPPLCCPPPSRLIRNKFGSPFSQVITFFQAQVRNSPPSSPFPSFVFPRDCPTFFSAFEKDLSVRRRRTCRLVTPSSCHSRFMSYLRPSLTHRESSPQVPQAQPSAFYPS